MLEQVLGAVGGLASSFLGSRAADKANKAQMAMAEKNIALQKEFAQSGIRWKVKDAQKAGIHPLYALGANTASFSPVSVGTTTPDFSGLAQAGQNIGNAIDATQDKPTRLASVLGGLQIERATLENEVLRNQVSASRLALARGNPPFPTLGADPSSSVDLKASEQEATAANSGIAAATPPSHQWFKTPENTMIMLPAQQYKQAIEDNLIYENQDVFRTRIAPAWSAQTHHEPPMPPAPGMKWEYRPAPGDWKQVPRGRPRSYVPRVPVNSYR